MFQICRKSKRKLQTHKGQKKNSKDAKIGLHNLVEEDGKQNGGSLGQMVDLSQMKERKWPFSPQLVLLSSATRMFSKLENED